MQKNTLRNNVICNYAGQFYVTLIGILVLPLYLNYMGAEAYGLVGFYTLVQAWMQSLDLGMSPALGREVARLKGRSGEYFRLWGVVNSFELIFSLIALSFVVGMYFSREWVSTSWLTVADLPLSTVSAAVGVMAVIVAMRWIASLSRSGINAYEAQVWINVIDVVINTLRYPGSLVLVIWLDGNVLAYFYFQLVVALLELVTIRWKFHRLLPPVAKKVPRFSYAEISRIAPFALSIGYTAGLWVLVTQFDKLLLSKILTLSDYGYFTLVATVVSGVSMLVGPVSKAILPRMTVLLSNNKEQEMLQLYRRSTRLVVAFVAPIVLVVATNPEIVIYVWTGNREAAAWVAPLLPLFVLGSGLVAMISFQYYLQYAYGNLRYHVAYVTVSVLVNVPLIAFAAFDYGAIGIGWVWLGYRIVIVLFWIPFVHQKFAPGLHERWLFRDVLPPVLCAMAVVGSVDIFELIKIDQQRITLFFEIGIITLISILITFLVSMRVQYRERVCD